jgi:hypothetical protein
MELSLSKSQPALSKLVLECLTYHIYQRPNEECHYDDNNHFHFYNSLSRLMSLKIFWLIRIRVITNQDQRNISVKKQIFADW